MALLEQYSSDAVRYWAASGRPGTDTSFDEGQMKVGRRLAIKILNASKFVLGVAGDDRADTQISAPLDRALLTTLRALVEEATVAFDGYDYARALERTERFFWGFCDNYVELVKQRAYGDAGDPGAESARAALRVALDTVLRLFAPHLPFVTEEVWSWWREGSVHRAAWPEPAALDAFTGAPAVYGVASEVLGAVRKAKTEQQRSLRTDVERLVVRDAAERLAALDEALGDVCEAARVPRSAVETSTADALEVDVELAAPDAA
jgi:valyl-tRNA synthetase